MVNRFLTKNDSNGDGTLSSSELSGLSADAFSSIDTNGDGKLSPAELTAALQRQLDALTQAFQSGGVSGVQDYLKSIQNTPQGEIIQAVMPHLFNHSQQGTQGTQNNALPGAVSSWFKFVIQQTQLSITTSSTNLTGLAMNATA